MILWWLVCLLVAHGSKWFPVISAQVEKSSENQFDEVCNEKNIPSITKGKDGYCKGHIDAGYLAGDDEKTWHTTIMCSLRALEDCTVLDGTITIESIKSMIRDPQFATDKNKLREDFQRLNNAFVYPKRILNIERTANSTSSYSIPEKNPWPDHKVLKYTQNLVEITGALFIMDVKVDTNNEEIVNKIKANPGIMTQSSDSSEKCETDDRYKTTDLECDFGHNFDKIKPNFQLKAVGQLFPSLRIVRGNYISSRLPQSIIIYKTDFTNLRLSSLTSVTRGEMLLEENRRMCIYNEESLPQLRAQTIYHDQTVYNEDDFLFNRDSRDGYICGEEAKEQMKSGFKSGCSTIGKDQSEDDFGCFESYGLFWSSLATCWDYAPRLKCPSSLSAGHCDEISEHIKKINNIYCQIDTVKRREICSKNLCTGGCKYKHIQKTFQYEKLNELEKQLCSTCKSQDDDFDNNLYDLIAADCSGCNWATSVTVMKDTNSNPICYSRQLHGTYRLVNDKDEERYNMTFYNGCPADIPWRGGNIDDIEIKKTTIKDETDKWRDHVLRDRTEEMSNSKQKIVTGWKCMNFTECAAFGYHVIHCDDDQCTSGSCTTEDNFLENLEESSGDGQCYDRSKYENGWLENNIPQRPSPCRNGFSEEKDKLKNLRNEFKIEVTFCVRKNGAQKKCHFCHELVISSKEDLDLIGDCTDIRAVGGLKIIDYNDDPSMLTKALKQVQRIDCLTIENSDSILDLKFFDSLIEITGETWNHTLPSSTLINGKVQNSLNSTVYCFTNKPVGVSSTSSSQHAFKERIRIQNNDWIANLFPARNIQELSKNIRLEIKLKSCDKLKLPKSINDTADRMESTCPGSMICDFDYPPNGFSRNQRLCPLEFFDLVLINDHKTLSNGKRDPPDCFKKGDIDILDDLESYDRNKTLLFFVNPSDLISVDDWKEAKEYKSNGKVANSKFCQKRVQMPQIDQTENEKIVLKYAEAVEWYFKKIKTQLHSNLQEAKRCGDLETCTDFVISGLTNEKRDGSVVIKFDSFFRNKLAEDKLGNQIGDDIWDYDPDKLTDAVVYYIVDPDQRYLKNEIFRHSKSRDASNCGWKPVSWKKNGDFGLCYTGEKWKTTKTKWNDVSEKCKSKRLNDCRCYIENSNQELQKNYYSENDYCNCPEYKIDQNIVREDKYRCKKCDQIDITIKPDTELLKLNTNYTYYAEMIIQLDDDKCKQDLSGQQGCRLTVRSEHRHFLTDSGMANPVQNLVIKEKKAPENNGTKYLVHFDPPVSSTGHLKNFISLAKVSINRKDDQSSTLSSILKNSNFKEESESQFDYLSLNPTCSWAGPCRTGCCDDFKKLLDKYSSEHQQDVKERTSGGKKSVLPRSGGYGFGSDQRGNSRAPGACSETKDKKMQDLKNFVSKRSVKINAYSSANNAQIENESSTSSDDEGLNYEGGQLKAEIPSDTSSASSSESSAFDDDIIFNPTASNETEPVIEEYDWMYGFNYGDYGDVDDCDSDYEDCGSEKIDASSEIPKIEDIPPKCVLQRFICDDLLSPKGHDYGLEDNCTQIFEIKSDNEKSDYFSIDDETEILKDGETKLLYKCSENSNATSVPLPKTNLTVANQKISLMDMYFIHQCVQCYKDIESLEWPRKVSSSSSPDHPQIMPLNETFDSIGERKRRSPSKDDEQPIIVEDVDRYNLAKVIKKYMTVSENPYDRDKNPQALFENLIPGKRYDFEVYACNENVPGNTFKGTKDIMHDVACGKPQILHTLIKMATDIRNTSNLIQEKVEEILQTEKEKIQSPRAKMDTRLTNPQNSNDRPRLLPRILDSELRIQPKKGYKLPNSVHDFRMIFRSPDWVKQNGNVLVYIIVFSREDHDDMNKIILTDEAALGNLNAYLSNHTDFCKTFIKMNIQKYEFSKELNLEDIDCTSKEPEIQKYSNSNKNSKFLKKPEKCYFERDPDKCGYRMISYSDIKGGASEPMEHFFEEGKKYELKDFRVLTSGILRSVLKPEDVVEDILKDECVKCKRSVSQYYPYYSQENDPEIEQLKMEFEVTSKKWVQIVVSISLVLSIVCVVVYKKTFQKEEKQKAMLETTNPDFFDQFRGGNEYYYADDSTNQIHEQYLDCNIYSDDSVLGGGHFGKVYIGDLRIEHFRNNNLKAPLMDDCSDECLETCECKCENKIIKVAVKVAKGALTGQDDRLFFREQGMLNKFGSQGFHTISYYGWSYLPGDDGLARHCLVMEYISGKDLLNWLRKRNTNRKSFVFKSVQQATKEEGDKVTLKRLMKFCADIADGMCYLSKFAVVHRDLAARNCLVQINENEYETIKICDFGMMRELQIQTTDYYKCAENTDLPLKWCAPESLENKKFSIESDVWSYGVLLFEIATLGELPYYTFPDSQIRVKLTEHKKGGFNEFNCLYHEDWRSLITGNLRTYGILEDQLSDLIILIKACCNYEQDKRPKFDKIMEIMIGQQFQQLWTSDDNIHPLQDEPYKSTFFFFNTPDHEELNAEDASTVDTEDESRASITDKTPLIRNDDVRRASKFEEVSNHIGLPTVSWTSSK